MLLFFCFVNRIIHLINKINVFISPSYLKDSFAGYEILLWQPFSFSTLNMSSHWLLMPIVLILEKLVVPDMEEKGVKSYSLMVTDSLLGIMKSSGSR